MKIDGEFFSCVSWKILIRMRIFQAELRSFNPGRVLKDGPRMKLRESGKPPEKDSKEPKINEKLTPNFNDS